MTMHAYPLAGRPASPASAGRAVARARPETAWIDELERDLSRGARERLLSLVGGQRREVPRPGYARSSKLAQEVGADVVLWLARRFGGTALDIPSQRGREAEDKANRLRAAILDAGLDTPTRSANAIAAEFGVTSMWVRKVRTRMREEAGTIAPDAQLSLFGF